jgi:hypothetical protein
VQVEERPMLAAQPARQQPERRLGVLERVAEVLELLEARDQVAGGRRCLPRPPRRPPLATGSRGPDRSESSTRRRFPTASGGTCS